MSVCGDFGGVTAKGEPCQHRTDGLCWAHQEGGNPGGRPTKYEVEYVGQVYKLCLLGATDEQIADFFEINVDTVHEWTAQHPEFSDARKRGKAEADANVAEALYNRALGYTHPEEKIFQNNGEIIRADTLKHYPPDTAAAFIWLKNRAGWRDKQSHEVTGADGGPIETRTVRVPVVEEDADTWSRRFRPIDADEVSAGGNGNGRP